MNSKFTKVLLATFLILAVIYGRDAVSGFIDGWNGDDSRTAASD